MISTNYGHQFWQLIFPTYADRVGFAVAGAWLVLALGGSWSRGQGWVDRLGRVIGWCWIAASLTVWLLIFLK